MDILFATTNQNKVTRIKKLLKNTDINLTSLIDLNHKIIEPKENGKDGIENSIIKAEYYYKKLKTKTTVLAQDDTLYLFGVSEEDNPKKDVKLPVLKKYGKFTDKNAYKYYSNLVKKYNKEYLELEFRYGHAVRNKKQTKVSSSILSGRLYAQPNSTKTSGYFLSDMIKVNVNGVWKYYSDLNESELIDQDKDIKRSINSLLKE